MKDQSPSDAEKPPAFDGKAYARRLKTGPGVYLMRDARGAALYVGKAKNLRKRVTSYFDARPKNDRTSLMLTRVAAMEVSLTRTEGEALLLENEWIKSLKPRYNVLLRDDKSYPYLYINTGHSYPRVAFHRGGQSRPGKYFGPFPSAGSVRESINLIQKLFRLRNCEDSVFSHRSRPCLQYQIKRCTAPCVGLISEADYQRDVYETSLFLKGRNEAVIRRLIHRMERAADQQDYEFAARYRDQISILRQVQAQQFVAGKTGDVDFIAIARDGGSAAVQVVNIRGGRNLGQRAYFPANAASSSSEEVMQAFLGQYYRNKMPPALMVLSHRPEDLKLLESVFSEQRKRKVKLLTRPRGERSSWLAMAADNAANALRLNQAEHSSQQQRLESLAELLQLDKLPQRIECFDISHISGDQTVGSCVVFGIEGPVHSAYRRFNLKDITPGDDYAAMQQVLSRRYQRVLKEEANQPELIIVDGGKGQLKIAVEVLESLDLAAIPVLAIAKGPARKAGHEEWLLPVPPFSLRPKPDSVASHLVQQIRNEAHRFAITGHRLRRGKKASKSVLEDIPGIGSKRRRLLLQHFGGLQGLDKAGVEELARLPGINLKLARAIYDHLHGAP